MKNLDKVLKMLDKFSGKHHSYEVLSDCFEMWAICISNRFDMRQYEERETRYCELAKKYDENELKLIAEMFSEVFIALTGMIDNGFEDYLGQLYMASATSSAKAGQFFTPYCVSRLCAELSITEDSLKDKEVITMCEPACGSGGMVLATADVLWNEHKFNYATRMFAYCGDVDARCVHMCYIQLALAGIPAVIEQRDALSQKLLGGQWYTPAYCMQYLKFRKYANE